MTESNHISEAWKKEVQGNKLPFHEHAPKYSEIYNRIFIIAGGPSLKGFDFSRLNAEMTIGINRVWMFYNPMIHFAMDWELWRTIKDDPKFQAYPGYKVWLDLSNKPYQGIYYIKSVGRFGYPVDLETGLYHGNNSGYGAVQLAITLGFKEIYLLGYDMKVDGINGHFYGHKYTRPNYQPILNSFIPGFEEFSAWSEKNGIRIINCNPDSGLRCFPFGDIDKILEEGS